jgi:hypothetical protein
LNQLSEKGENVSKVAFFQQSHLKTLPKGQMLGAKSGIFLAFEKKVAPRS